MRGMASRILAAGKSVNVLLVDGASISDDKLTSVLAQSPRLLTSFLEVALCLSIPRVRMRGVPGDSLSLGRAFALSVQTLSFGSSPARVEEKGQASTCAP